MASTTSSSWGGDCICVPSRRFCFRPGRIDACSSTRSWRSRGRFEEARKVRDSPRSCSTGAGALAYARHPSCPAKILAGIVGSGRRPGETAAAAACRVRTRCDSPRLRAKRSLGSPGSSVPGHMNGELKIAMVGFGAIGRSPRHADPGAVARTWGSSASRKRSPPSERDRAAVQTATQFVDTPAALAELPADLVIECAGPSGGGRLRARPASGGARTADCLGGRAGRPGARDIAPRGGAAGARHACSCPRAPSGRWIFFVPRASEVCKQ